MYVCGCASATVFGPGRLDRRRVAKSFGIWTSSCCSNSAIVRGVDPSNFSMAEFSPAGPNSPPPATAISPTVLSLVDFSASSSSPLAGVIVSPDKSKAGDFVSGSAHDCDELQSVHGEDERARKEMDEQSLADAQRENIEASALPRDAVEQAVIAEVARWPEFDKI